MSELTPDAWAIIISNAIKAAEDNGMYVAIENTCCGCCSSTLEVSSFDPESFKSTIVQVEW